MAGDNALARLQKALQTELPPTPFVGAGLSMAVTGGAAQASWVGLLEDGVKECERVVSPLPPGWGGQMRDQLEHADMVNFISVAEQIVRRLGGVDGGRGFSLWIQEAIGNLHLAPGGEQILAAVRNLAKEKIIVTTNYDTLIEDTSASQWRSHTWTDEDYASVPRLARVVVHLHGLPQKPESIILGSADYQLLGESYANKVFDQSLFAAYSFIFIGCGTGLGDPHIGLIIEFVDADIKWSKLRKRQQGKYKESYILVRGSELRQFRRDPVASFIHPVSYGSRFEDLGPFLQKLAAGQEIDVSQDPDFYDQVTARPRRALLDLAGPAQHKLRLAQDALQRTLHAMGQVEHRGAKPPGMALWDFEDQQAVHEQLAASVTSPTESLLACSEQLIPLLTDAGSDIGQLSAPAFAEYATDLAPMMRAATELADQTSLLLDRAGKACADLGERARRSSSYEVPFDTLLRARVFVQQANDTTTALKNDLDRLRNRSAAGEAQSAPGLAPRTARRRLIEPAEVPDTQTAHAAQTEIPVRILGQVAAGEPILITADEEFLAVPPRYGNPGEVFALEVRGDSMIGDHVVEGDYIIVRKESNPRNGDMVVVTFPSEDGGPGNSTVKRWQRNADGSVSLIATNPDVKAIPFTEDARVEGKVIGLERWNIG
jgi:SOS-response transcriptional repressor LexA